MKSTYTLLGGRTPEDFLGEYWQKRPLLIRDALPGFQAPITPEELAGLSLEPEAESRLILERGGEYPWQLRHGPFEEDDFETLPESHWTLLVQEVDQWVPGVAALLENFSFLPRWRMDDVMVSFAPDGGNVGAHIDNYDVFLLQGLGKREWRIGAEPVSGETLLPDLDVSMLADFEPDETWILKPGDMLYLPPRIAHHGIAIGDCMTFSIGFRAPSHEEILSGLLARAIELVDPNDRYGDPDLKPVADPGLISSDAVRRVRELIENVLSGENVRLWFGSMVTEPKGSEYVLPSEREWTEGEILQAIHAGAILDRVDANRFAYVTKDDGSVVLFAHGEIEPIEVEAAFAAPLLTGFGKLDQARLADHLHNRAFLGLLTRLVNAGHLAVAGT